jgi:hypothetical protein
MNKDLPLKVRHIFSDLDPAIWNGVWLDTLQKLLSSNKMLPVWNQIISQANLNKKNFPALGNSQFIKWELKAFVAQAVKLVNKNYNKDIFIRDFEFFFRTKGYKFNKEIIKDIYESIHS